MSIINKIGEFFHHDTSKFKTLMLDIINESGGVTGLLSKFKSKGLGGIVEAWLRGKDLESLTIAQVNAVFSHASVQKWASKVGLESHVVVEQISKYLPILIHHLCPNGQVPEGPISQDQITLKFFDTLKGMFKKAA